MDKILKAGSTIKSLKDNNVAKAVAALAFTQILFAVGTVYLKWTLVFVTVNSLILLLYREVLSAIILVLSTASIGRPKKKHFFHFLIAGFCLFLNQALFIVGLDFSGAIVASCVQPSQPIFTFIIAVLIGEEKIELNKILGLALAVSGAVWVVLGDTLIGKKQIQVNNLLGDLCLICNCIAMAVCYIFVKKLNRVYNSLLVISWIYAAASIFLALTVVLSVPFGEEWILPTSILPLLAYLVIICSCAGYITISWSNQHLDSSQVSAFTCLQPIVGSILAVVQLRERPDAQKIVGGSLITVGLLVTLFERQNVGMFMRKLEKKEEFHV